MSEEDFELTRLFREDITPDRDELFAARVALEVSRARMALRVRRAALYLAGLAALGLLAPVFVSVLSETVAAFLPALQVVALGLVAVGGVVLVTSRLQAEEA